MIVRVIHLPLIARTLINFIISVLYINLSQKNFFSLYIHFADSRQAKGSTNTLLAEARFSFGWILIVNKKNLMY